MVELVGIYRDAKELYLVTELIDDKLTIRLHHLLLSQRDIRYINFIFLAQML